MNLLTPNALVERTASAHSANPANCCRSCDLLQLSLALFVILWWQNSGLDLLLSQYFGQANGFALQHHWLFERGLHRGCKWLCVAIYAVLIWNYFRPLASLPQRSRAQQRFWFAVAMLGLVLVSALKYKSGVSCPWDLQQFGGTAVLENRWSWQSDGGPGRCFPSGHVSAAFSLLALPYALRGSHPKAAQRALLAVLALAAVMSITQVVRGAHLLSHVAYSGWICWACCVAADRYFQYRQHRSTTATAQMPRELLS